MEMVLVDVGFWPLSWAGFFLDRRDIRTSYQFLLKGMDIFVTGRPRTHNLTRFKTDLGLREQNSNRPLTLALQRKVLKCFLTEKPDGELAKKLQKKSHLSSAIQNRVSFFCLSLLTIFETILEIMILLCFEVSFKESRFLAEKDW